jgi:hypothetical protein
LNVPHVLVLRYCLAAAGPYSSRSSVGWKPEAGCPYKTVRPALSPGRLAGSLAGRAMAAHWGSRCHTPAPPHRPTHQRSPLCGWPRSHSTTSKQPNAPATVGLARGGQPYQSTGLSENPVEQPTLASQGIDKNLLHPTTAGGTTGYNREFHATERSGAGGKQKKLPRFQFSSAAAARLC